MADSQLRLIARRDDGALLVGVEGSPCALTVAPDDAGFGIWANSLDAAVARGNWTQAEGGLPAQVQQAVAAFIARPNWCNGVIDSDEPAV